MANKQEFVRQLAEYLQGDAVKMSIRLQVDPGDPDAQQWRRLRAATPLFGYPSVAEAQEILGDWLDDET